MKENVPEGEYPPNSTCDECKGHCCKTTPGVMLPSDIEPLTVELVASYLGHFLIIDRLDRHGEDYFIRPRTIVEPKGSGAYSVNGRNGQCVFLDMGGCILDFADRPWNCRALKPAKGLGGNHLCTMKGDAMSVAAKAWKPHRDLLHEAAKKAGGSRDDL